MNTDTPLETTQQHYDRKTKEAWAEHNKHMQDITPKPQPEHSPLPWQYVGKEINNGDTIIAEIPGHKWAANDAKLIVRSVNHADKLAEALREAREVIAEEYGATVASGSPLVHRIDAALAAYEEAQS